MSAARCLQAAAVLGAVRAGRAGQPVWRGGLQPAIAPGGVAGGGVTGVPQSLASTMRLWGAAGCGGAAFHTTAPREARLRMRGTVVSAKAQKSVVVAVERIFKHPVVKKFVKERSKFMAHDELDQFKVGDEIWIEEHRPISRRKRFMVRTYVDESCGRLVRARIRLLTLVFCTMGTGDRFRECRQARTRAAPVARRVTHTVPKGRRWPGDPAGACDLQASQSRAGLVFIKDTCYACWLPCMRWHASAREGGSGLRLRGQTRRLHLGGAEALRPNAATGLWQHV